MGINQWFKFYGGEYLSDPKMGSLQAQERSIWITLLSLASISSISGIIEFLTIEVLLKKSGIEFDPYTPEEWNNSLGILAKFEKMKMIKTNDNGSIEILNWGKRQETALTGYERVKKYRQKNKIITNDNDDNESDNDRVDKIRVDKNNIDATALKQQFFSNSLMEDIKKQYPDRNYSLQFDLMADWWIQRKKKLPQNISAFVNWLKNTKSEPITNLNKYDNL